MNKEEKCEMKHLYDLYEQALKDYEELQQRIDKAIEYIETNNCGDLKITFGKDLLEILKGDSNE